MVLAAVALAAGQFFQHVLAEETEDVPKALKIVRADARPVIDGKLDDEVWKTAAVIDDLRQVRPGDGTPEIEPTIAYVLYDKDAIYIGARMFDKSPDKITRNILKQGTNLGTDDRFSVLLDPFNSRRQGYRFDVNANGVRNDMLYQNGSYQISWTVIWEAAANVDERGWTAEIAIPFKTLPFDPNIQSWGFNVSRATRRHGEESVWVSRNRNWHPGIVGVLDGMEGLDRGTGLDVVTGYSSSHRKSYVTSTNDTTSDPSLDVYYRITPSLTGSLTVNTDFSAAEVDERQVNLTRFSPFFPEKRNFFLNDADLFEFGRIGTAGFADGALSVDRAAQENARPFFSRRIGLGPLGTPVDLEYGGKLSGRVGDVNIGALAVRQDGSVYDDGTRVDPTTLAVARASVNVLGESSVGFIATSGDPTSNRDNSLVGADFLFMNSRLPGGRTLEAELWYQQTDTEGIEGEDSSYGAGLRMPNAAGARGGVGFREVEKNFLPALGYVNRSDIRIAVGDVGYTHFFETGALQSVYFGVDGQRVTSLMDGELQTQVLAFRPLQLETRGVDILTVSYLTSQELVNEPFDIYGSGGRSIFVPAGRYKFDEYGFTFQSGDQREFAGELSFRRGDFYDGERVNVGGKFVWQQSRHLTMKLSYDWNDISLPQGDFITRLMSATTEVGFSSELSWVSLLQYDDVSEVFGAQSRLVWVPKAGREFYLIFDRSFQDYDKDNSFRSVNSAFSARLSYTFRF